MILKLVNPLESLEDRIAIQMNICLRASLVFSSSCLKQRSMASPSSLHVLGAGLSGFVTYQTREVSRCSPLPVVFVGIKLPEFKKTISPSALNFQRRNSADIVYAQTATLHTN